MSYAKEFIQYVNANYETNAHIHGLLRITNLNELNAKGSVFMEDVMASVLPSWLSLLLEEEFTWNSITTKKLDHIARDSK